MIVRGKTLVDRGKENLVEPYVVPLVGKACSLLFSSYSARKEDGDLEVVAASKTTQHHLWNFMKRT